MYLSFFPYVAPTRQSRSNSSYGSPTNSRSQSRSHSRSQSRTRPPAEPYANPTKPISRNNSFGQIKLDGLMTVNGETRLKPLSPGKTPNLVLEDPPSEKGSSLEQALNTPVEEKVPNQQKPEWEMLVNCCEALSLFRIRDGMGNSLGPVVGYLRRVQVLDPCSSSRATC
jgi:hypothetical protein